METHETALDSSLVDEDGSLNAALHARPRAHHLPVRLPVQPRQHHLPLQLLHQTPVSAASHTSHISAHMSSPDRRLLVPCLPRAQCLRKLVLPINLAPAPHQSQYSTHHTSHTSTDKMNVASVHDTLPSPTHAGPWHQHPCSTCTSPVPPCQPQCMHAISQPRAGLLVQPLQHHNSSRVGAKHL